MRKEEKAKLTSKCYVCRKPIKEGKLFCRACAKKPRTGGPKIISGARQGEISSRTASEARYIEGVKSRGNRVVRTSDGGLAEVG